MTYKTLETNFKNLLKPKKKLDDIYILICVKVYTSVQTSSLSLHQHWEVPSQKKKKKKHWEVNFALGQGRNAYDNLTRQFYK